MADGWLYDRDGYATLRVPFVFIPEGAAQPADWLVEHPNHIRVPAMFRAARQPSPARAPEEGRSGRGRSSSVADAATAAEPVPGYAPIGPHQGRRYPPPPQIDRSGYFQENPVATYLRINQTLDAMALGATSPLTSKGSQRTNGKYLSTVPQALPGVLSESDTAAVGTAESGSAVDPTAPVELLDGKGKPVKGEPVSSDRAGGNHTPAGGAQP